MSSNSAVTISNSPGESLASSAIASEVKLETAKVTVPIAAYLKKRFKTLVFTVLISNTTLATNAKGLKWRSGKTVVKKEVKTD